MKRLAIGAALALVSCGGEEPLGYVEMHISGVSALAGTAELEARIFGSAASCSRLMANPLEVRAAPAHDPADPQSCDPDVTALCVFSEWTIDVGGGRGRITGIPIGLRTISVIAVDDEKNPIGHGCAEGVEIEEKIATPVEIQLTPVP